MSGEMIVRSNTSLVLENWHVGHVLEPEQYTGHLDDEIPDVAIRWQGCSPRTREDALNQVHIHNLTEARHSHTKGQRWIARELSN